MKKSWLVVMSLVALGLGACGSGGPESATESTGGPEPEPSSESSSSGPRTESGQSAEWQARLDEMAEALGIEDPPPVAPVRIVGQDYAEVQRSCLSEAGFGPNAEGAIDIPSDQTDAFNLAMYTCEAQYPVDPKYLEPLTDAQFRIVHSYLRDEAVPCLADLGYVIPAPPSEQTYLASINTESLYTTSGELIKLGLSNSELEKAIAACPEVPSLEVLYDE